MTSNHEPDRTPVELPPDHVPFADRAVPDGPLTDLTPNELREQAISCHEISWDASRQCSAATTTAAIRAASARDHAAVSRLIGCVYELADRLTRPGGVS